MPTRLLRDFTDSILFDDLSAEAERTFVRLLLKADDYGRFHANPKLVKAACFPLAENLNSSSVGEWLLELSARRLIYTYSSGAGKYLAIPKFQQRLRAGVSKFPAPDGQPADWMPPDDGHVTVKCQADDGQLSVNCQPNDGHMAVNCRADDGQLPVTCPSSALGGGGGGGGGGACDIMSGSALPPPDVVSLGDPSSRARMEASCPSAVEAQSASQSKVEGKPAPTDLNARKAARLETAKPVLLALNQLCGRQFRETEANLLMIAGRLEEDGVTIEGVLRMLRRQVELWKSDPKMSNYLRPETLFNRTKFDSYYANREQPTKQREGRVNGQGDSSGHGTNGNPRNAGIAGFDEWNREFQARAVGDGQGGPPA